MPTAPSADLPPVSLTHEVACVLREYLDWTVTVAKDANVSPPDPRVTGLIDAIRNYVDNAQPAPPGDDVPPPPAAAAPAVADVPSAAEIEREEKEIVTAAQSMG
jgi:hypothetical protein